jgi:16S rRNA processing protein RimM
MPQTSSSSPSSGSLPAGTDADLRVERVAAEPWVAVGVIRGAFGVHGALKVEPYADVETSVLNQARNWRIQDPDPSRLPADVRVTTSKQHGGFILATIRPEVTREQVLALKGREVLVSRDDFPPAGPDEYYWADLIGCRVTDPTGALLGSVVGVDDHGAQSVLRLDNGILIPFVPAHVLEVGPAEKRIVADWAADWL